MAAKNWTLIDVANSTQANDLTIRPSDVGGAAKGYSVSKRTLRAGLSEGVEVLRVDNGKLALEILLTRGLSIWKAWLGGEEIGWQSPIRGPVHPKFVPTAEPSGLGWLEGFDELLVRCGLESNGAPEFDDRGRVKYPLHGRIANRPAQKVDLAIDGETGEITVVGEVDESRFLFHNLRLRSTIKTRVGEAGFRIQDEIINLSERPAQAQILYHVNFGRPLLDPGARLVAPVAVVMPRDKRAAEGMATWDSYAAEQPGFAEQVYFLQLLADERGATMAMLKNAHSTRAVSLHFAQPQLPCFTLWKNTMSTAEGYVTGLEPGSNYPNPRSFEGEQGRVIKLPPRGSATIGLQLAVHGTPAEVEAAEKNVQALQRRAEPRVFMEPQPGWCPPSEKPKN